MECNFLNFKVNGMERVLGAGTSSILLYVSFSFGYSVWSSSSVFGREDILRDGDCREVLMCLEYEGTAFVEDRRQV